MIDSADVISVLGLKHTDNYFCSNGSIFVAFGFDLYFMLSLLKLLREKKRVFKVN